MENASRHRGYAAKPGSGMRVCRRVTFGGHYSMYASQRCLKPGTVDYNSQKPTGLETATTAEAKLEKQCAS
ncbi:hypothetical protein FPOA_01319 [Fusarium poae]|uniref:Uncharacterized protein n=1 Tax=Fusarium poae TaxID=36050 RepID=A0A1B8B3U9_FUSPO|nr:hypothetical protein FPOA_01319 [Fusarium poae]